MPTHDNLYIDRYITVAGDEPQHARRVRFQHVGDSILKRAALLLADDRTLVELAVKNGASHRALGRALSIPAGTVSRRLRRVLARLSDPLVIALCEPLIPLPQEYRQLGIEHFLQGQTPRMLADLHQMSFANVRQMLEHIKGWHRGLTMRRKL